MPLVPEEVPVGERVRLADVVQERGEPDDRAVRGRVDAPDRVAPEVLAGDFVLTDAALPVQLGQDHRQQPCFGHQTQPDRGPRRPEKLEQLGTDPFAGEVGAKIGVAADRGERLRLDLEPERGRQPDRTNHPQGVLAEAPVRISDRPQDACREVLAAPEQVDEPRRVARRATPGQGVDGEVPPRQVLLDRRPELDRVGVAEVGVGDVPAEGRYLVLGTGLSDDDRAVPILVQRPREQVRDPIGDGVCGDVPIRRLATQDRVAQAAAHHVGRVAGLPERRENAARRRRDPGGDLRAGTGRDRVGSAGPRPR
jgi:hypothetical protein